MKSQKLLLELFKHQTNALRNLSIIIVFWAFLFAYGSYLVFDTTIIILYIFTPYIVLMILNHFILFYHKKVVFAYTIVALLSLIEVLSVTMTTGGYDGGFLFLLIAISSSTFIYSKTQGYIWFVLSITLCTIIYILHINNYKFVQIIEEEKLIHFKYMTYLMLITFVAFISFTFSKVSYKAFKTKKLLDEKNQIIEKKNEQIMDSIRYAKKIQDSLLASDEFLDQVFKDHFVLHKPKDVVGGDFYWAHKTIGNKLMWAVGDCTGHGVPGAFMSMIGVSLLNEIVIEKGLEEADQILKNLGDGITRSLNQDESKSGMELGLCVIDPNSNILQYSGARSPLYLIRNNELFIYEGSKKSVGFNFREANNFEFNKTDIRIEKGDILYLFSDGYYDQIGGPENKRFMSQNLQKLLLEISNLPMKKQREILNNTIEEWHKDYEQVDDILVMGVKL